MDNYGSDYEEQHNAQLAKKFISKYDNSPYKLITKRKPNFLKHSGQKIRKGSLELSGTKRGYWKQEPSKSN